MVNVAFTEKDIEILKRVNDYLNHEDWENFDSPEESLVQWDEMMKKVKEA